MNYLSRMNNLTFEEICKAPTRYLLKCLKEDLDPDLHDTISYELFEYREAGKGEDIYGEV